MNAMPSSSTPTRRLTVRDVALKAGVNQASVSVVLNGAKSSAIVSEAARVRILAAAEELGYRRNAGAANMKSGRSGWITLLQANAGSLAPFNVGMLNGVSEELAKHQLHLHVERVAVESLYDGTLWPSALREWMSDGIILVYDKQDVPELEKLILRHRIPSIWTNARRASDCIYPDDEGAFFSATEELLKLGHERIFYMHAGNPLHYSTRDRQAGYEKAMAKAGLSPEIGRLVGEIYAERYDFIRSVVARSAAQRPTAVICYSPQDAMDFWSAGTGQGLSIPRDLTVVGASRELRQGKKLSGMNQPFIEVGAGAVRMLLQKIKNPQCELPPQAVSLGELAGDTHAAPASAC